MSAPAASAATTGRRIRWWRWLVFALVIVMIGVPFLIFLVGRMLWMRVLTEWT
jgi:hypothetical protein